MTLGDFIDFLLKALHLRKSNLQKWQDKLAKTEQGVKSNHDRLEDLRSELHQIEQKKINAQAKADSSAGMLRQTYLRELQQYVNDENRFNEQLAIIFRNYELGQSAIAKIRSIILALESPVQNEDIDDVIVEVDQIFQLMNDGDVALNELNSRVYVGTDSWQVEPTPQQQGQQAAAQSQQGLVETTPESVEIVQPAQPVQPIRPVSSVQQTLTQVPAKDTVAESLEDLDQGVRSIAEGLAELDENN
ncbi:MAG: hypothetical protein Q4G03_04735 [Planctomycetia bacterium]|nr:hypothetical protein [Planctomycetia bacterium]